MEHKEKIEWMKEWCFKNKLILTLEGECGFGRECVGVSNGDCYPDYHWFDPDTYEDIDDNGDVWSPEDAYHKHTCVAVLGRGERAEGQLYEWLKWFDDNGFVVESGINEVKKPMHPIEMLMGKHKYCRMIKKEKE